MMMFIILLKKLYQCVMFTCPFEENLDADWLPYNCTIIEYDIFFKDGKYYYEGEEPDNWSARGERIFEYKEGKLVKQQFKPY